MAWYSFGPLIAVDPAAPGSLLQNATGQVYATSDTTFTTPLAIRTGGTAVVSNGLGVIDEFEVENQLEIVWKSGPYTVRLASFQAVRDLAEAAEAASASAVQNMGGAARIWGRTTAQGLPTVGDGALDGDWCLMDAS